MTSIRHPHPLLPPTQPVHCSKGRGKYLRQAGRHMVSARARSMGACDGKGEGGGECLVYNNGEVNGGGSAFRLYLRPTRLVQHGRLSLPRTPSHAEGHTYTHQRSQRGEASAFLLYLRPTRLVQQGRLSTPHSVIHRAIHILILVWSPEGSQCEPKAISRSIRR